VYPISLKDICSALVNRLDPHVRHKSRGGFVIYHGTSAYISFIYSLLESLLTIKKRQQKKTAYNAETPNNVWHMQNHHEAGRS
jgi:hypothetical protein